MRWKPWSWARPAPPAPPSMTARQTPPPRAAVATARRGYSRVSHAATDQDRLAASRTAAGLYHGELADGAGYEWAGPHAETARRRVLDAWTTIADIYEYACPPVREYLSPCFTGVSCNGQPDRADHAGRQCCAG